MLVTIWHGIIKLTEFDCWSLSGILWICRLFIDNRKSIELLIIFSKAFLQFSSRFLLLFPLYFQQLLWNLRLNCCSLFEKFQQLMISFWLNTFTILRWSRWNKTIATNIILNWALKTFEPSWQKLLFHIFLFQLLFFCIN